MPAVGPSYYLYFWPTEYQTPFLGLINLLEWLTELRKTHLFTGLSICCCCCSVTQSLFVTPWTAACQASLSPTISQSLLKLMSFESVMPSNHLVLCLLLLLLPSIFPSIRVFSKKSAVHIRWPKYWRFSISPSNEYSGLISFKDQLVWSWCPRVSQESSRAPQFKSISSSALSLIYGPALTSVHDYGKNHSSDYTNLCQSRHYADFVGKVISLLFNMLSRLVIDRKSVV